MRIILFLFLILIGNGALAQEFIYQAELTKPDSSAYYKINISGKVYNQLNKHKSDIRIYDSKKREIPYLWKNEICQKKDSSKLLKIFGVKFIQNEFPSLKKSKITIDLEKPERVNRVEFKAKGPVHFKRYCTLVYKDLDSPLKKRKKVRKESVYVELNSEDTLSIDISEAKVKQLIFEVDNEDNLPLVFEEVTLWQSNHFLVAWLEKGNHYEIKYGNSEYPLPNYDLRYFKSKLPKDFAVAEIAKIKKVEIKEASKPFYQNSAFIWSIIVFVILFLGFISIKLVKEMGK